MKLNYNCLDHLHDFDGNFEFVNMVSFLLLFLCLPVLVWLDLLVTILRTREPFDRNMISFLMLYCNRNLRAHNEFSQKKTLFGRGLSESSKIKRRKNTTQFFNLLTKALFCKSKWVSSRWPFAAAKCKAVRPFSSNTSIRA